MKHKPIITVKNVLTFETHEGVGFTLDMYVDEVKTAEVSDAGDGSGYKYKIVNQAKFDELQAYIDGLPAEPVFVEDTKTPFLRASGEQMTIKIDVDVMVSDALETAGY